MDTKQNKRLLATERGEPQRSGGEPNGGANIVPNRCAELYELFMQGNYDRARELSNGQGEPFLGIFDGGGHTISGLRIVREETPCVGLFGAIGSGGILISSDSPKGRVRNLHLRDITVQGYSSVGGLAGELGAGSISNCSVKGVIKATSLVGGPVGWSRGGVEFCRTVVDVSGDEDVGDLNRLTTAQMREAASFRDFGWDFESVWTIREGADYPRLRWEPQLPLKR